ncbi:MAG: mechanosensitive ion channel family protein [Alphaproteobacteria bacterium]|nr:mechanosensitive ion channel family protein [Alphaproteobacteria bacterium]MCB9928132.1 mechanosensitive ion channel family protein [Alphaproteobacteria bacterium]
MKPITALSLALALLALLLAVPHVGHANPATLALTQGGTAPAPAAAAAPTPPADLRPDQVEAYVAPLSDREARAVLISELHARAAATETTAQTAESPNQFAMLLQQRRMATAMLGEHFRDIREFWRALPDRLAFMHLLLTNQSPMPEGLFALAVALGAGGLVAFGVQRFTRQRCRRWLEQDTENWPLKFGLLAARLALELVSILVFGLVCIAITFVFFDSNDPMRLFVEAAAGAVAVTLLVWVTARFVLAPRMAQHRLFVMDDRTAKRATWLAVLIAFLYALSNASVGLVELLNGGEELVAILRIAVAVIAVVLGVVYLLTARVAPPAPPILRAWPWLGLGVLTIAGALWVLNAVLGAEHGNTATLLGLVLFMSIPTIDATLRAWLAPTDPDSELQRGTARITCRTLVGLALALALAFLAQGAGIPLLALLQTPDGRFVVRSLVRVAVTVVIAAAVWAILRDWIDRWIKREKAIALANADMTGVGEGEGGSAVIGTRAQTLLPLFRATMLVVIIAIAALMILSNIGVDIGPLLAGAGVVGIAIGFGAQALVRDVVSGIFFLIDDAFRVGEYVEIDNLRGEVEKISIRSMQLRHHRGMVQTIPFGELRHITNYSRDWVIYKQDFLLPFETDIEKVRKMIKKLGQQMLEHPDYGHLFIDPLKCQGVTRIEEAGMVVRTKFTCKPRQQFLLRRYANLNIQRLFMENGIQFARRRIQVEGEHGSDEGASAAQAVLEAEQNAAAKA